MVSTLIKRLNQHIASHPDKIIVLDSSRTWTWSELMLRATDYAHEIREHKLDQKIVPLIADRTGETVAAMLSCILSNVAFSPLSSLQPKDRIKKCLDALGTKILLVTNPQEFKEEFDRVHVIHAEKKSSVPLKFQDNYFKETQILYTLFTSGSTGVPKGVLVSAGNIENTMLWSETYLDWKEGDIVGGATNFFFDISIFDLFSMIYFNVPLAIYSQTSNSQMVKEETEKFKITSVFSVPLFFCQISRLELPHEKNSFRSLRRIISGGDFFPPKHILNWMVQCPEVQIFNVWGPTETSIVNTMHLVSEADLTILNDGKSPPVGATHIRMPYCIVESDRKTMISGPHKVGEIVMLGDCVSQGYLNAPELTAKAYGEINGQRAYFTEDLGFNDEKGNLNISGRMGSTVKISGYRVDLDEINSAAVHFDNVYLASSFVKRVSSEVEELWLVLELKDKIQSLDIFNYKSFLRSSLPHYMVPKRIFVIPKLPTNANGKIDRRQVSEGQYE